MTPFPSVPLSLSHTVLLSFNTLQFLCIHLNSLFSVSIFTASSFSLTDCTLTHTNTWVIHTYRNTLASSLTCSHTHANWHTASFDYCTAYTHATHMWKCPQDTAFLILTLPVVGSSWPPENELWLSIFTPWTAGDCNGTLSFSALPVVVNLRSCSCDIAGRLI